MTEERNTELLNAYKKYGNMAKVGRIFGISRERVRQIIRANEVVENVK